MARIRHRAARIDQVFFRGVNRNGAPGALGSKQAPGPGDIAGHSFYDHQVLASLHLGFVLEGIPRIVEVSPALRSFLTIRLPRGVQV